MHGVAARQGFGCLPSLVLCSVYLQYAELQQFPVKPDLQKPPCPFCCHSLGEKERHNDQKRERILLHMHGSALSFFLSNQSFLRSSVMFPNLSHSFSLILLAFAASVPFIKVLSPSYHCAFWVNAGCVLFVFPTSPMSHIFPSSITVFLFHPHLLTHSPSLSVHQPLCLPS